MRTRIMNQLHVVALNEGVRLKKALWRPAGRAQLESLLLAPWTRRRRQDLLELLDQLTPKIQELTRELEQEVEKRPVTRQLMTHPGVGPLTALAFELVIGTPERFGSSKQIASYVGLVPCEESSGDRRRLGHISKQGNSLLRFLLVEAAQITVRLRSRLASPVSAPGDATGTTDRQGRDGPQARRSTLLDVAQGMGLRTVEKTRCARGRARKSPGCAVDHR